MGIGLIAIIGLIDDLTGEEIAFSLFYVIPISLVIWYVNRGFGITAPTLFPFVLTIFCQNKVLFNNDKIMRSR